MRDGYISSGAGESNQKIDFLSGMSCCCVEETNICYVAKIGATGSHESQRCADTIRKRFL